MAKSAKPQQKRLGALLALAVPALPLTALQNPPVIYLPPYYAGWLGLELGVVGLIFLGARLFDIVVDPLLGAAQDRTVSRLGRRKLWMLVSTPFLCAIIYMAFIGMPANPPLVLVCFTVFGLYFFYAAMMIAHLGWAADFRPEYHQRTRVLATLQVFGMFGQVAMLALPAIVQASGMGDFADGVHAMGWAALITLPLMVLIAVKFAPEPPATQHVRVTLGAVIAAFKRSKALRGVLVPDLLLGACHGVAGALFVFYFRHKLGFASLAEAMLLTYFVSGLIGIPLWVWLAGRLGKHRALQIAFCYVAVTHSAMFFIPPGNVAVAFAIMLPAGFATAAGHILLRAMMADVVEEDFAITGSQKSGFFFGLLLTTSKVGLALGPATYGILQLVGFDPQAGGANTPGAFLGLSILFAVVPPALYLAAAFSLRRYPLDRARQHEIALLVAETRQAK